MRKDQLIVINQSSLWKQQIKNKSSKSEIYIAIKLQSFLQNYLMIVSFRVPSRSQYRSFRYSLNRQQNVKTADHSSAPKFRIKKNSVLESTMMKTGGLEQLQLSKTLPISIDPQKTEYLKNFYSLMDSQRKMSIMERSKWNVKPLKFKIQNIKQLQTSQFTLLDPFHTHFKSLEATYQQAQSELQNQHQQVRQIKGQMQNLNKRIHSFVNDMQKSSTYQLSKLSSLLKQNTIRQQQIKLKFKHQIASLQIQHQQNSRKFAQILNRNISLQQTIFNCRPFQLRENQEWQKMENTHSTTLGINNSTLC